MHIRTGSIKSATSLNLPVQVSEVFFFSDGKKNRRTLLLFYHSIHFPSMRFGIVRHNVRYVLVKTTLIVNFLWTFRQINVQNSKTSVDKWGGIFVSRRLKSNLLPKGANQTQQARQFVPTEIRDNALHSLSGATAPKTPNLQERKW